VKAASGSWRKVISAIIPARNEEESIARAVESVAAQPEIGEVIVVNDQSTDRTAEILEGLARRIDKLEVLNTAELPAGWVGKNHAVAFGATAAGGDWLLFTDADTYHQPGSARRALADAVENNAVLVSYSPEQELGSFWERVLVPFVYCRLSAHFSFARVNRPDTKDAAANGQYLMILRDVYAAVGGHSAIRGEILEDVALARRVKKAGYGIYFTAPVGTVRTRMYRSFGAIWQGWTKNLYPLMGGTVGAALRELAEVFPWFEGLLLIFCFWYGVHSRRMDWALIGAVAAVTLVSRLVRYGLELYKNLYPVGYIQYYVPGVFLYSAALVASWWKNTHGRLIWKGREYASGTKI
jgi:glycosyltransferase involved in cell wall biosynthesis